jgi:hypothetical protein
MGEARAMDFLNFNESSSATRARVLFKNKNRYYQFRQ